MKHLITFLLSLCSIMGVAQTVTNPPSGSKPYGTPVAAPSGEILVGRNGSYTYVTRKAYTDSLTALGYTKAQVDSVIAFELANVPTSASGGLEIVSGDIRPIYGSSPSTIAQGNDIRIINGQTAYGWGDYRQFGLGTNTGAVVNDDMSTPANNSLFSSTTSIPVGRPYQLSFPMGVNWYRSTTVRGQFAIGYNNTGAAYRSTLPGGVFGPWNFINSPSFRKFIVDPSESNNRRNDQASIVKLNNGRLAMAYSRFGSGSGDTDASTIWISFSDDNGYSWNTPTELVGLVSQGAYIPSFYRKANGNILMVFFVREQITPSYLSTIRAIEYSADMSSVVTPMYTIHSGGYFPIASDRLFYDDVNGRLLMPYPFLYSGSGTSTSSVYHGGLLMSSDEGATWINTSIDIIGKLSVDGYGGAVEPGIFRRGADLVYYYRTPVGNIYYNTLTYSSGTYTSSPSAANIGLQAMNAQSSIKFVPEMQAYVATYIRLGADATNVNMRKQIDLSVSYDAMNWGRLATVENVDISGIVVNAPNVFVGDRNIIVSYSLSTQSGYYDLKTVQVDYAMLNGHNTKQFRTFATNPLSSEHNEIGITEYKINQPIGNRVANVVRNVMDVSGDIIAPNSFYNFVAHQTLRGTDSIALTAFGNFAPQTLFDGIRIKDYSTIYITGFTGGSSFINNAHIENYSALHIPDIVSQPLNGTITNKWAIKQDGSDDINTFMGNSGFGIENPTVKVDVGGSIRATGTITSENVNELPTRSLNTSLGDVLAGETLTYTTTYTGVSSGDVIAVGVSGSIGATELIITASSTSTAGQVVVKFYNPTGSDIPIGNISIKLKAFK